MRSLDVASHLIERPYENDERGKHRRHDHHAEQRCLRFGVDKGEYGNSARKKPDCSTGPRPALGGQGRRANKAIKYSESISVPEQSEPIFTSIAALHAIARQHRSDEDYPEPEQRNAVDHDRDRANSGKTKTEERYRDQPNEFHDRGRTVYRPTNRKD